jgi:hypothetical protein
MATTTNYSWTTPDDTALVKDGAAAIRTLGSSVDTTTKNLNPSTTLGDIEYRSSTANTNTRLGIGSTGQVLTVSGGVPAWGNVAAGGMTLLSTTTLSGSSTTISSIDQTYKSLYVRFQDVYASMDTNLRLRLNGDTGSNHFTLAARSDTNAYSDTANESSFNYIAYLGSAIDYYYAKAFGEFQIDRYSETQQHGFFSSSFGGQGGTAKTTRCGLQYNSTTAISSLTFLPQGGTFSGGTVYIYGVK